MDLPYTLDIPETLLAAMTSGELQGAVVEYDRRIWLTWQDDEDTLRGVRYVDEDDTWWTPDDNLGYDTILAHPDDEPESLPELTVLWSPCANPASDTTLNKIRALHHLKTYQTSASTSPTQTSGTREGCACELGRADQPCPTLEILHEDWRPVAVTTAELLNPVAHLNIHTPHWWNRRVRAVGSTTPVDEHCHALIDAPGESEFWIDHRSRLKDPEYADVFVDATREPISTQETSNA